MKITMLLGLALMAAVPATAAAQDGYAPWKVMPSVPEPVGAGGSIVAGDAGKLYVICGGGLQSFYRYVIAEKTWESLPPVPKAVGGGGSAAYLPGANHVYLVRGNSSQDFYRYNIATSTWTTLAPFLGFETSPWDPVSLVAGLNPGGNARVWGLVRHKLATTGAGYQVLNVFRVELGTWTTTNAPPGYWPEGKIVYHGPAVINGINEIHIYGLPNYSSLTLWVGRMSGGGIVWEELPSLPLPEAVGPTSALAVGPAVEGQSRRRLFCLPGQASASCFSLGGAWEARHSTPEIVGEGAGLAHAEGGAHLFAVRGGGSSDFWRLADNPMSNMVKQWRLDGLRTLPQGGSTAERGFVASLHASDDDDEARTVEVEWKPVGIPFNGEAMAEGPSTPAGEDAPVRVENLPQDQDFRWQIRKVDALGLRSPWIRFGGSEDDLSEIDVATRGHLPSTVNLAQQRLATGAPVGVGEGITDNGIRIRADLEDSDGDSVRLELEMRTLDLPFSGQATTVTSWVPAGTAVTVDLSLANGAYHWRHRVVDVAGDATPWTSFGGNAETSADFVVLSIIAPGRPAQRHLETGLPLAPGTRTLFDEEVGLILEAVLVDEAGGDLRLEVELRRSGAPFEGVPTHSSAPTPSGLEAALRAKLEPGAYRWRFRAVDASGDATSWEDFGGNPPDEADVTMGRRGGSAAQACAASTSAGRGVLLAGLPLLLACFRRRS